MVFGHQHTEANVRWINNNIFSMVVGCLIDNKKYAFEYAKDFKKLPISSCGIIYKGIPFIETLK